MSAADPSPAPVPIAVPPPPPPPASKAAVAGGVGGAGVLIYVIDRLLADQGQLAAGMLTKLSPLTGPLWASWPLLALIAVLAWVARDRWVTAQHVRAVEAAAARASSDALGNAVAGVAEGLTGLRSEVHSLRSDLRQHADQTDARFRTADADLRDFVRGEISPVRTRVEALERRRAARRTAA